MSDEYTVSPGGVLMPKPRPEQANHDCTRAEYMEGIRYYTHIRFPLPPGFVAVPDVDTDDEDA
jgi:hypothetical protein